MMRHPYSAAIIIVVTSNCYCKIIRRPIKLPLLILTLDDAPLDAAADDEDGPAFCLLVFALAAGEVLPLASALAFLDGAMRENAAMW